MGCLPCEKEIIDNGMGKFAALFFEEIATGTEPIEAAIHFYYNVLVNITQPLAAKLVSSEIKLTDEQHAAVMAQIDKQCYNADKFIAWAIGYSGADESTVAGWTGEILAMVKDDQTFYTELIKTLDTKDTKE